MELPSTTSKRESSMSTSLLYHAFAVRGYRYVKAEYVKGGVVFTIEQPRKSYRCSACGASDVIKRGQNRRKFRTVSIGNKVVCTLCWTSTGGVSLLP